MTWNSVRVPLCLGGALALAVATLSAGSAVRPARSGQPAPLLYLDLVENPSRPAGAPAPGAAAAPVPPNSSNWHELHPVLTGQHAQQAYTDNGDGLVSIGDVLRLDGLDYRIVWAGPTYFTTVNGAPRAWEPSQAPHDPAAPVGETWQEVVPAFGTPIAVTAWADNGTGTLDPGDELTVVPDGGAAVTARLDVIGTNITVEPLPVVPTAPTTWSGLKRLFGIQ